MALSATLYKAHLTVNNFDTNEFGTYELTVARHPSETEARLMLRLIAFANYAHDRLEFTRGLCVSEEPELWQKDDTGHPQRWIELGLPEFKRLKQRSSKATQLVVFAYGDQNAQNWREQNQSSWAKLDNLSVTYIETADLQSAAQRCQRRMELHVSIQDGLFELTAFGDTQSGEPINIRLEKWK
ncbi:hypothetical protein OLMES_4973 [Oleiphilus messinensis]|uniref:YaeQ family protein n=1 Tax=Oleiphilus messinensis TaxID=141451 RepID=A0A1Y0IFD5_9GAMM|nr:YaeQ family protein [Oleiphilus messinensis]ARU58960.1 hypothetical protein OLMES_4973 [Oleiphilus messinensis]